MTPIIITLTITAIAAIAAMAIIAVGHQTEERPGTIDLTGIRPRRGWTGPSASRVRAEAPAILPVVDSQVIHLPANVRPVYVGGGLDRSGVWAETLAELRAGREVFELPNGAIVHAEPGSLSRPVPRDWFQLSETELAARVAQAGGVHGTGADAA